MTDPLELPAMAAYGAFAASSAERHVPMPPWRALRAEAREEWRAVADAALMRREESATQEATSADGQAPKVFVDGDREPEVSGGTIAVVNYGDYRRQEVWVASGANIGNWYPLGGEFWTVWDKRRMPPGVTKEQPTWDDVTARGPVTLVVAMPQEAYQQGWTDGRRRLLEQVEELRDDEDQAPVL